MNILTFDLETENHTLHKRKASPFDSRNYIVQIGWNVNGGPVHEQYYEEWHREQVLPDLTDIDVICGFNIKFDLLWVWKEPELIKFLKKGGKIYCGQYMEYLMGGMTKDVQMVSMNNTVEQYGGGQKIDAVKEMWEAGMLTSEIPRDLLTDYLVGDGDEIIGDVMNTWLIYQGQMARLNEFAPTFYTAFEHRMDGLLATTEMEYNGMFINMERSEELRAQVAEAIDVAKAELEEYIPELPPELEFNWGSVTHKSCLIFGGVVKYSKWQAHTDEDGNVLYANQVEKHPTFLGIPVDPKDCVKGEFLYTAEVLDGIFIDQDVFGSGKKKGEPCFKNITTKNYDKPKGAQKDHFFEFKGYTKPHHSWKSEMTDAYENPLYSTAGSVIETLGKRNLGFTTALAKWTGMVKDLGTYYWVEAKGKKKGMLTLVDEGIIHHKLNHTSTVTSRMSSSDPNLQNIPRGDTSDVKKMFVSRFTEGLLAEIDYSQLEVVIQGVLSEDPTLCEDLRNKTDFHCKRLSAKVGEDYLHVWNMCHVEEDPWYKKQRTIAKTFSFQRAYGAGAGTIAADIGVPVEEIKELIAAEEKMYPGVVQFDRKLEATINANRIPTKEKLYVDGIAFSRGQSHWDSPTGTRYVWKEGITPTFLHEKGKYTGFSPTERKNYPMQGFGGEVVQTMLGKVFRYFVANDMFNGDVLLINSVHDCVLLDGHSDKFIPVVKKVQSILESVPEVFNEAFPDKLNITVPFPCESEVGKDLFYMEVVH